MVMFSTLLMSVALFAGAVGANKTSTVVPADAALSVSCPEGSTCCLKGAFTNLVNEGTMNIGRKLNEDCTISMTSGSATCGGDADCSVECDGDCEQSMVSGNPPSVSVDDQSTVSGDPASISVDETACADFEILSAAEKTCTSDNQCMGLEDTNFGSDCHGNRAEHQ